MRFLKALLLLLVFFVGLLFFVQNSEVLGYKMSLVFDLYVGGLRWNTPEVPFFFLVIVAFAVGMLLGIVLMFLDRVRVSGELRKARKDARSAEKALNDMKAKVSEATGGNTEPRPADGITPAS